MSNAGTGPFVSFTMAVIVALTDFQPTLSVTVRLIVMFRYVRFPLTSFTVRLTIDWPACMYVKFVRMPQVVVPGGVNLQVKFAAVMWPFGSVLSSPLNVNDVFPATYAW